MLESYRNTKQALIKNAVLNECLQVKGAMLIKRILFLNQNRLRKVFVYSGATFCLTFTSTKEIITSAF